MENMERKKPKKFQIRREGSNPVMEGDNGKYLRNDLIKAMGRRRLEGDSL